MPDRNLPDYQLIYGTKDWLLRKNIDIAEVLEDLVGATTKQTERGAIQHIGQRFSVLIINDTIIGIKERPDQLMSALGTTLHLTRGTRDWLTRHKVAPDEVARDLEGATTRETERGAIEYTGQRFSVLIIGETVLGVRHLRADPGTEHTPAALTSTALTNTAPVYRFSEGSHRWLLRNLIDADEVLRDLRTAETTPAERGAIRRTGEYFTVLIAKNTIIRVELIDENRLPPIPEVVPDAAPQPLPGYDPGDLRTVTATPQVMSTLSAHDTEFADVTDMLVDKTTTSVSTNPSPANPYPATTYHGEWFTARVDTYRGIVESISVHTRPRSEYVEQLNNRRGIEQRRRTEAAREKAAERAGEESTATGPRRRPLPHDIDQMLEMLHEHGFVTDLRHGGHWNLSHPDVAGVSYSIPSTPSDHRGLANSVSDVRRLFGIDLRFAPEER